MITSRCMTCFETWVIWTDQLFDGYRNGMTREQKEKFEPP